METRAEVRSVSRVLNGGIIGTLLDCNCNWTAAYHLMKRAGADHPPCTVTAEYTIKLLRPTPTDNAVSLSAHVVDLDDDRATIEGTLSAGGRCAQLVAAVFVAVKEGHPAYHRCDCCSHVDGHASEARRQSGAATVTEFAA